MFFNVDYRDCLPMRNMQQPKFPQYADGSKRLESFKTWPDYLPVEPETLADAGLVYTGVGDSVHCYSCGGGLRNWDRGDSAWFKHAQWYSTCPHVLLVKGQGFVDRVKRGETPKGDEQSPVIKPDSDEDHLNSPAALSNLENGFSECAVKRAIKQYIKMNGNANYKGADLCMIIQQDEEESNTTKREGTTHVIGGAKAATGSIYDNEQDTDDDVGLLFEDNRRLKGNKHESANIIILPCGHMASCPQCAPARAKCPVVRMAIKVSRSVRNVVGCVKRICI